MACRARMPHAVAACVRFPFTSSRMHRALVAASLLALLTLPFRKAEGQAAAAPSLTGACAGTDSAVDLSDVAEQPDRPPVMLPSSETPRFPASLRRPGYSGSVVVGFVVNPDGKVRPGTATVLTSTDSALTRWGAHTGPTTRALTERERRAVEEMTAARYASPFTRL